MTSEDEDTEGQKDSVTCLAFSGKLVTSASRDCTLRLWSIDDPMCLYSIKVPGDGINCIEFSPDENFIGAATINRTVFIWSIGTSSSGGFRLFKTFSAHEDYINSLGFSSNGRKLATASDDRTVRIWSMSEDNYHYESLKAHNGGVTAVALSLDILVLGLVDQTVQI
ncbi:hypothetical protein V2G26_012496 [Clonostachys chloroleuca]